MDNQLLSIIKKRVKLVSIILKNKNLKNKLQIKRIKQILRELKRNQKKKDRYSNYIRSMKSLISACIKYEYRNF